MVTDGCVEILLAVRGLGTYWLLLNRPAAIGAA
jgi:hypothetical protein